MNNLPRKPVIVLLLGISLVCIWVYLSKGAFDTSSPRKMSLPPVASNSDTLTEDQKMLIEGNKLTASVLIAIEKWDVKLCESLNKTAMNTCKDIFFSEQAMQSKDVTKCSKIWNEEKKKVCQETIQKKK